MPIHVPLAKQPSRERELTSQHIRMEPKTKKGLKCLLWCLKIMYRCMIFFRSRFRCWHRFRFLKVCGGGGGNEIRIMLLSLLLLSTRNTRMVVHVLAANDGRNMNVNPNMNMDMNMGGGIRRGSPLFEERNWHRNRHRHRFFRWTSSSSINSMGRNENGDGDWNGNGESDRYFGHSRQSMLISLSRSLSNSNRNENVEGCKSGSGRGSGSGNIRQRNSDPDMMRKITRGGGGRGRKRRRRNDCSNIRHGAIQMASMSPSVSYPASLSSQTQLQPHMQQSSSDTSSSSSLWPPWPFNLIYGTDQSKSKSHTISNAGEGGSAVGEEYRSSGPSGTFLIYVREKIKVGLRQMQTVGSALSFHLPQSAPPLIALALLPSPAATVTEGMGTTATSAAAAAAAANVNTMKNKSMFLSNAHGLCRKMALASLGIAVLSWADYEVRNVKRLTPLPLPEHYRDIRRAISILPPFLPEAVTPIELDPVLGSNSIGIASGGVGSDGGGSITMNTQGNVVDASNVDDDGQNDENGDGVDSSGSDSSSWFAPAAEGGSFQSLKNVYNDIHVPGLNSVGHLISGWQKMARLRQREMAEYRRKKVMDELYMLQQARKRQKKGYHKAQFSLTEAAKSAASKVIPHHAHDSRGAGASASAGREEFSSSSPDGMKQQAAQLPLGYALVTGASRGIGRALAVELARWQIPLILVARDLDKLTTVADEIEMGYGVSVICIQADLSNPHAAKRVHDATRGAGLRVDILVNNAGICTNGDVVDSEEDDIRNMVNVNVGSVTTLSHLYSRDMKQQRRGRMLFVSSVVGAAPGGPGVAAYAATKAYEKSLAMSMGRELEKYGVGVTCIMPGAVKGTSFAVRSKAEDAICWKYPFYPMTAPDVASRGVRAMLSGDAEVVPGWHNRLFLKILSPLLPQRITTSVVGFSFSPLRLAKPSLPWKLQKTTASEQIPNDTFQDININVNTNRIRPPPRILKLPADKNRSGSQDPSSWSDSSTFLFKENDGDDSSLKQEEGRHEVIKLESESVGETTDGPSDES